MAGQPIFAYDSAALKPSAAVFFAMQDSADNIATSLPSQIAPPRTQPISDLFLISFTILFFESACIRFFGSTVVFLTFFTNIILMACFLGMSIGLLCASQKRELIRMVIPVCLISASLAWIVLLIYMRTNIGIAVGSQSAPQQIYFGTEYRFTNADPSRFVVPIELVAGVFFVLIALSFIGLGQVMGRAFDAIPNRVLAYTADILGSISGIVLFALLSYLRTPPLVWFAVVIVCCLRFIRPWGAIQIGSAIAALVVIGLYSFGVGEWGDVVWSPYYKVVHYPNNAIWTNSLGHQQMLLVPSEAEMYLMPHRLAKAAANRTFDDVLIIGAGSGNDVAAALYAGAKHVDAIEIEPAILDMGRQLHPNHPYSDPRVTIYNDDGRSFLRKTNRKYDLVVFALVDSLVLHSSYSSLRLESFLFTKEALCDAANVLKPGGVLAMYNFYRQGWVVGRLVTMAHDATGSEPMVISVPYQPVIRATDSESGRVTFILTDAKSKAPSANGKTTVDAIHDMIDNGHLSFSDASAGNASPELHVSRVDTAGIGPEPRDDWPFLYLRDAIIPALNIRGMILIAVLSLILIAIFAPLRTVHLNWTMLFLGAGFMLLESKGVVHMALLFGATWIVNAIVFAAILVMILFANIFVLAFRPRKLWPYYLLLGAALLVNIVVPMNYFLSLGDVSKVVASCAVVFVPVFFAGVIFGTIFRDSAQPDLDFGSNVIGIILGGISEYFSLVLGFNHLLIIAIAFYALSWLLRRKSPIFA